jgi:hypothetical protein
MKIIAIYKWNKHYSTLSLNVISFSSNPFFFQFGFLLSFSSFSVISSFFPSLRSLLFYVCSLKPPLQMRGDCGPEDDAYSHGCRSWWSHNLLEFEGLKEHGVSFRRLRWGIPRTHQEIQNVSVNQDRILLWVFLFFLFSFDCDLFTLRH